MKRYNYPNLDRQYSSDTILSDRNRPDKVEEKINSVRTAFSSLRVTPRDLFPEVPLEESFTSAESTASPRSGGDLTDRATSPSAASVTSIQSVSSQVSVSGRRSEQFILTSIELIVLFEIKRCYIRCVTLIHYSNVIFYTRITLSNISNICLSRVNVFLVPTFILYIFL